MSAASVSTSGLERVEDLMRPNLEYILLNSDLNLEESRDQIIYQPEILKSSHPMII